MSIAIDSNDDLTKIFPLTEFFRTVWDSISDSVYFLNIFFFESIFMVFSKNFFELIKLKIIEQTIPMLMTAYMLNSK